MSPFSSKRRDGDDLNVNVKQQPGSPVLSPKSSGSPSFFMSMRKH